jgi:3-oxoadipate enol-lactonase
VLLLHGWIATADLNWWNAYAELGRYFRVIAMDLRGHGRGLRGTRRFSFADCAGDAAVTLSILRAAPAIVVGYSMGGPIAQVTWRDHPNAVRGLVLCATSGHFRSSRREHNLLTAVAYAVAYSPPTVRRRLLAYYLTRARREDVYSEWLISELAGHRMSDVLEAGRELHRFDSSSWIGAVDVPTACLVMQRDGIVPPRRQYALAAAIPGASVRELDADHLACARNGDLFVTSLVAGCREVAARSEPRVERGGVA